jgi:hypothetical protein
MYTALIHGVLSILALLIGSTIIVWVLYNEFVQRQPGFQRGGTGFGVGPIMVTYGLYWGRQALAYVRGQQV